MAAEDELRRIAERARLELVIARPPVVYGPGAPANIARLLNVLSRIPVIPVRAMSNARSLVYGGNLTDAILFLPVTFTEEFQARERSYPLSGGRFIRPLLISL